MHAPKGGELPVPKSEELPALEIEELPPRRMKPILIASPGIAALVWQVVEVFSAGS